MLKFAEWMFLEMHKGMLNYIQKKYPKLPSYIIKDRLYIKNYPGNAQDIAKNIQITADYFNEYDWQLKSIHNYFRYFSQ